MTIYATRTPAPSYTKGRRVCGRCGIEHSGRHDWCLDCSDVTDPKPCKAGHERTEDNVYVPKSGRPQCGACKRAHANAQKGWDWTCQLCGRRADQGEVLCGRCGPSEGITPLSSILGATTETAPGQVRQHLSPQGLATIQLREPHRD